MNVTGVNKMDAKTQSQIPEYSQKPRWIRAAALTTVVAIGLGGCSSLPEWANPVDWYDSAFSTDGSAPPTSTRKVAGNQVAKEFPTLKSVPTKAPVTSSSSDRAAATTGLIAARDKSKYTDEDLRSGGKTAEQLAALQTATPLTKPKVDKIAAKKAVNKAVAMAAPKLVTPQSVAPAPAAGALRPVKAIKPRLSRLPKLASAAPVPVNVKPAPPSAPSSPMPAAVKPAPVRVAQAVVPTPVRIAQAPRAPLPPLVAPVAAMQAPSFPNAGQGVLAQIFAASLAQSASSVSTAPASSTFNDPVAQPIGAGQSSLPGIVLAAYNDPLTGKSAPSVTVNPGAALDAAPVATADAKKLVVHFSNGSSKLGKKARKELRSAAEAYKTQRRGVIRVVGHASHFTKDMNLVRHRMINFKVSLDRANEVARELMRYGVDASAVRIEAVSDADPVYFEHMPEGQAHNRRAEVFLEF